MSSEEVSCNPCYNGYHVHGTLAMTFFHHGCNPCYNGYHVHAIKGSHRSHLCCNPCYNGYHVHAPSTLYLFSFVVILVIMDIMYMRTVNVN